MRLRCAPALLLLQQHVLPYLQSGQASCPWHACADAQCLDAAGLPPRLMPLAVPASPRCRAPVPWQGIELESLPQLDAPCTCASSAPGLSLDFRCQQVWAAHSMRTACCCCAYPDATVGQHACHAWCCSARRMLLWSPMSSASCAPHIAACALPRSNEPHAVTQLCHPPQLMEGPAADALLGRLQPSLVGQGALVNVGEMRLTLPAEAAAVLLPGHSSAGAGPQGRAGNVAAGAAGHRLGGQAAAGGGGSGAQGRPTPPPRQQCITGGGGSGGGRVVADCDDW